MVWTLQSDAARQGRIQLSTGQVWHEGIGRDIRLWDRATIVSHLWCRSAVGGLAPKSIGFQLLGQLPEALAVRIDLQARLEHQPGVVQALLVLQQKHEAPHVFGGVGG